MYNLLRAAQINQKRSLLPKLQEKLIGVAYLTSGLYMKDWKDYIILTKQQKMKANEVHLLDPEELATEIIQKLFTEEGTNLREFTKKEEWDIYSDFKESWKNLEPAFYKDLV